MDGPRERFIKWSIVTDRFAMGRDSLVGKLIREKYADMPVEKAKLYAKSDPEYTAYLEEYHKALQSKAKAQIELENLQSAFDSLQSALSFDKEHLRRLGG